MGRILGTLRLMLHALLPESGGGRPVAGGDGALVCRPRQIRLPLESLLNHRGELRLFFPGCLPVAAPLMLFRLKRRGFSNCSVLASGGGLLLQGRR